MASYDIFTFDTSVPFPSNGSEIVTESKQVVQIVVLDCPAGIIASIDFGGRAQVPIKFTGQSWRFSPPERNGINLFIPSLQVGKIVLFVSYMGSEEQANVLQDGSGPPDDLVAASNDAWCGAGDVSDGANAKGVGVFNPPTSTVALLVTDGFFSLTGGAAQQGRFTLKQATPPSINVGFSHWRDTRQAGIPQGESGSGANGLNSGVNFLLAPSVLTPATLGIVLAPGWFLTLEFPIVAAGSVYSGIYKWKEVAL